MCAPADTDPVVGGGPAHRDTVNSLVLKTLLVIRTCRSRSTRTEAEFKFIWKAAETKSSELKKLVDEDETLDYGCVDHYNFNTDLMSSEQRMFN